MSHQKKYAQKVKDRNCKSEVNDIVKESPKDYLTPRVQKYRQMKKQSQIKVKVPFMRTSPKRLTSSERTNVSRATKFINTLVSPRKKAKIISRIVETAKSSPRIKDLLEFSNENLHRGVSEFKKSYT